jgi:Raf kinase inhibitor-like YbhB/YbcL family protein
VKPAAALRGALCTGAAVLLAGCGGGDKPSEPLPKAPAAMGLTSAAFQDGGTIPMRFTCSGRDFSPPLRWSEVPRGTRAFAVLMQDVDADRFLHWSVLDIPSALRRLAEGRVPPETVETKNSFGDTGWGGPCPPEGDKPHHYVFAVYALNQTLGLDGGASPDDVQSAVADHAIGRGTLTGLFGRG